MAGAISIILNLRDNASKGLMGVARNTKGVSKEMKGATATVVRWKNKFVNSVSEMSSKILKFGAAAATGIAAFAAKTGLSEAIDLEGYRMQLETATKDTEKAASIMKYAVDLANKTPFEGGSLVEGAAKFEAMGMSAKKWLTITGDMAAATNKDFDQATEALIDAQAGELERLKEFGITKAMILEQGEKMFSGVQIANNNGQIVNQEKFNEAMMALIQEKFAGGMEKQATTLSGIWSTITGITKSSLAKIAGMNEDGSVRAGSAFDILRQKASQLSEKLQQWQSDGTIDRLADKFTLIAQKAIDFAQNAGSKLLQIFDWITEHSTGVKTALTALGIAFGAFKVLSFVSSVVSMITTLSTFAGMLSTVAAAAGITAGGVLAAGAAIAGIALAVVAVGVLVYKNWDTICEYAAKLRDWVVTKWNDLKTNVSNAVATLKTNVTTAWNNLKTDVSNAVTALKTNIATKWTELKTNVSNTVNNLKTSVTTAWNNLKTAVTNAATALKTAVVDRFNAIKTGITNAFTSVKSSVKGVFDWFSSKFSWISDKISWLKDKVSGLPGVSSALNALGIGENASGTPYWRGGLTKINERGGEIVDLPSGTRIIPHDIAKKQNNGGSPSVVVNVVIQGNMIGNREYMEQTGEYIATKLMAAMDIT